MSNTNGGLGKLPKTNYSGLDYDNIIEDIINIIIENPEYSENWDDFISSNAGRMLIELFSYIGDQLATRIDWYINEGFIGTATQKKSVMRLLKTIGYKFSLPVAAEVSVLMTAKKPAGEIILTDYEDGSGIFYPFSIQAKDKNGDIRNFECIGYDPENERFDYKSAISVDTGNESNPKLTSTLSFYEGTTVIETFQIDTDNNPSFILSQNSIIKNSIRIYLAKGNQVEEELLLVNSFLEPNAQKNYNEEGTENAIPFIYNVLENDRISIEFAPKSLLPSSSRRPKLGDTIRVFYRYGGGENGNITAKSINTTKNLLSANGYVICNFVNNSAGFNGENAETSEHAALYAPTSIRTAEKTVTEDDYVDIGSRNTSIFKIKSYGCGNLDPNIVYTEYGEYIKPLEVWNYVLMNKSGWDSLSPTEYNKFRWMTLREENRFNEIYGFRKGSFNILKNIQTPLKELDLIYNLEQEELTVRNYAILDLPDLLINNFDSPNLKIKVSDTITNTPYWGSINNYFPSAIYNGNGGPAVYTTINNDLTANRISRSFSVMDLNISDYVNISIDSRPNLVVTFTDVSSPIELVNSINSEFLGSGEYGDSAPFKHTAEIDNPLSGLVDGSYNVKVEFNYEEQEVTITKPFSSSFEDDLQVALEGVFSGASFTIEETGASPGPYTLSITSPDGFVEFKRASTDDVFSALSLSSFGKVLGGGDYSAVATLENDNYIRITSPNTGYNSIITFLHDQTEQNKTSNFFEITVPSEEENYERSCFGYERLTLITNPVEENGLYQKLILETGNFDMKEFPEDRKSFYINYLYTEDNEIILGTYFNENFEEGQVEYREAANRLYNTYYNETYKIIDPYLSDFMIKFTSSRTEEPSIFTINNSWSLSNVEELFVRSDYDFTPGAGAILNINIDGLGLVEIEIDSEGSLDGISNKINNDLRSAYENEYPLYRYFTYSSVEFDSVLGSYIKIISPTRTKNSSIISSSNENFFLVNGSPSNQAEAEPSGDYAIAYTYEKIIGSNTENTDEIKTTDPNISNIKVGNKLIYDGGKGIDNCYVDNISFSEGEYTIRVTKSINITNSNVLYFFTDDKMKLQKISNNFPDLNFYTHFIFDKRFKEDIYEDFPLLSLDEDIIGNYLSNHKIVGLDNVFKQPIVNTFDIVGTIYYNNKLFSSAETKQAVENFLRNKYQLNNMYFGENIKRSIIISDIQNLVQVRWVEISYLGKDMTKGNNSENEIECAFNEILSLAENKYSSNVQIHGLNFTYIKGA